MFSIIIPVHNKLPHLDRSINSVLNQTYCDFELILIDDASTDGSSEKLTTFDDPRICLFRREKPGPGGYAARNLGMEKAKYNWVTFLDADDEWDLDTLLKLKRLIEFNSSVELITFDWEMRDNKQNRCYIADNRRSHFRFSLLEYLRNPKLILTGAIFVNKTIINKVGGFPDNRDCKRGGDVETWIRWVRESRLNLHLSEVLFYYYRDTVNRVTAKPNTHFCAYNTLKQIYEEENDRSLRTAIRKFTNRFIYNMLARQVQVGMPIDYDEIRKMYLSWDGLQRVAILHYMRLREFLR